MGIGPGYRHRGAPYTASAPVLPNPDPQRFTIEDCRQYGRLFVSTIHYHGCTNFEGRKVLLTKFDPRRVTVLDPHFAPGSGILARFEPTALGKQMAETLANTMVVQF